MGNPDPSVRTRRSRRPWWLLLTTLPLLLVALLVVPDLLTANGGRLRAIEILGPYEVAVFTDPTPPRPDSIDVSVLVTFPGRPQTVQGMSVAVELIGTGSGTEGRTLTHSATRDQADDPRYYAAKFNPGAAALWDMTVRVLDAEGEGGILRFPLETREPYFFERPLFLTFFALLPLAFAGWWLMRPKDEETE